MRQNIAAIDVKKLTSCGSDWETNQYTILNKVKEWLQNLHSNKLFPSIEESIQLNLALEDILRENIESKLWFDNEIRSRNINERFVVYEKAHQIGNQLDKLFNFIDWAIELNKPVLEEGRIIKNFVDENLFIKRISTVERNYNGKGYFTLPDNKSRVVNIYLYEIILDWFDNNLYQSMTANLVRTIPFDQIDKPIEEIVIDFINDSESPYEPVVYIFETDLDFPYQETMFPIAEEKLLKYLTA
jgi:hypothetical protein